MTKRKEWLIKFKSGEYCKRKEMLNINMSQIEDKILLTECKKWQNDFSSFKKQNDITKALELL